MIPPRSFTFAMSRMQCKNEKFFDFEIQSQDQFRLGYFHQIEGVDSRTNFFSFHLRAYFNAANVPPATCRTPKAKHAAKRETVFSLRNV